MEHAAFSVFTYQFEAIKIGIECGRTNIYILCDSLSASNHMLRLIRFSLRRIVFEAIFARENMESVKIIATFMLIN